jgi:alpha-aminoadipic semialdehyde synthase
VPAAALAGLTKDADRRVVYKVIFDLDERFRRSGGGPVTLAELGEHPERFTNGMQRWLGQIDMLVNGMYWVPALPRLLTIDDLVAGRRSGSLSRLRVIADIACDLEGAVEPTVKVTTPDNPVFVFDAGERRARDGFEGDGPVILAVDNLPAELPRESSADFGTTLIPFVPALARCDWSRALAALDLPPELRRAVIAHRGELAPAHRWLRERLP